MPPSRPDTVRASSFGAVADAYDTFRPRPPASLVDSLGPLDGTATVDVAAGTGLLTRYLLDLGARVTAVEPDARMAAVLEARSPGVRVVTGAAEDLPLPDASVDLVTVSSAWHWFDHERAAAAFARVLRPGGRLVVLWNGVDYGAAGWLVDLRSRVGGRGVGDPSRRAVELPADRFSPTTTDVHRWEWTRSPEEIAGLLSTYSGVIVDDPTLRHDLVDLVRHAVRTQAKDGTIQLPMACRTVWALRT